MILIVGYGSIGTRHGRLIESLGEQVCYVSKHSAEALPTIEAAFTKFRDFKYVLLANTTSEHVTAMQTLAKVGYRGIVLVEKPLFHEANVTVPQNNFKGIFLAYNLRFHKLIQMLRGFIEKSKPVAMHVYAGQYLPTWRPNRDYRTVYSSKKAEGGGVLRDLSHELDYASWLAGGWKDLKAIGGKYSSLEIDSDDNYSIMFNGSSCPLVSVNINYLDHINQRFITMIFNEHTVKVDFIRKELRVNDRLQVVDFHVDDSYTNMHRALLIGNTKDFCSLDDGLSVMKMIEAAETSAQRGS